MSGIPIERIMQRAEQLTRRRLRLCKAAPACPKCKERHQVQLFDAHELATWKCRECKHKWRFEPVTLEK